MNMRGSNLSDLLARFKRVLFGPLHPVPSQEKHEEFLGGTARRIMAHQGEGNVLLSAGQVEMGDGDFTSNG